MHKPDCLFCKMASGQIPCHEVWSSDTHLAFLTIFPNTEGVTVVIPRDHQDSYLFACPDQVVIDQILASKKVAAILDAYFGDVGRCGIVFEGFGIDHLHTKLFPMHGTADMAEWRPIESQANQTKKEFYDQYPGFISSHDAERADDAQLADLAARIRQSHQA